MMIEIAFGIIFIASVSMLWYRISVKIPELVAVPDEVIAACLEEDSAKIRLFFLHFRVFFHEKRYKKVFLRICEKALCRIHIMALRLDNATTGLLKKVRENSNGDMSSQKHIDEERGDRIYWNYLKEEKEISQTAYMEEHAAHTKHTKRKV